MSTNANFYVGGDSFWMEGDGYPNYAVPMLAWGLKNHKLDAKKMSDAWILSQARDPYSDIGLGTTDYADYDYSVSGSKIEWEYDEAICSYDLKTKILLMTHRTSGKVYVDKKVTLKDLEHEIDEAQEIINTEDPNEN